MRRTVTELIRRGFDSTVANWPLILIRVAEAMVLIGIAIGLVIATLVPILVSAGLSDVNWSDTERTPEVLAEFFIGHAILFVWIFVAICVGLLVFVAVHSFVQAGAAQVLIDADARAGAPPDGPRGRFAAFTFDRWLAGGVRGWWTVFWIYNIAWSIAALIILIPLLIAIVGMLIVREPVPSIVIGCAALVVALFLGVILGLITSIVSTKATIDALAHGLGASPALRAAWQEMRFDLARHAAVAAILIVVSFATSGIFASAGIPWTFHHHHAPSIHLFFAPVRLLTSLLNAAVSAAVANWLLASFAAIAGESRA